MICVFAPFRIYFSFLWGSFQKKNFQFEQNCIDFGLIEQYTKVTSCSYRTNERREEMTIYLKQLRKKQGYSQKDFAKMLKISPFHLNKIENGKKNLTTPLALRAAEILGVTLDEIFFN